MDAFTRTKEEDQGIERLVLHERVALIYRLIAPTLMVVAHSIDNQIGRALWRKRI